MSNQEVMQQENQGFMQVNTLEAAIRCSEIIAASGFCPKGYVGQPGNVLVALQMGQELGLKPMQALQNIAVINGRPSLWGDAMLAVCRMSKDWEVCDEAFDEKTMMATCTAKRANEPAVTRTFSKADAITAKLWNKEGPWTTYPKRMLQMRARGFALRDCYPDMLRGILIREEAQDMPPERVDYSKYSGGVTIEGEGSAITISEAELTMLKDKLWEAGSKEEDICDLLKIESIDKMELEQWKVVCLMLDKKISKKSRLDGLEINKVLEAKETPEALPEMTLEDLG